MSYLFVIFGATGDLACRKLFPALYKMCADKKQNDFWVIGAAHEDACPQDLINNAQQFVPDGDPDVWQALLERTRYQKLNFEHKEDFIVLEKTVSSLERKYNLSGQRLVYLSAPSEFFCVITHNCAISGLVKKTERSDAIWHKLVYEKPFGRDYFSAQKINNCIKEYFHESQIFRVDHYLTKEIVSNIAMIRFANCVFEPLWNSRFIDSVQIVLSEDVGVEGRGSYYDKYGVLRDVVQNHVLELIALIAMETPDTLLGDAIAQKRADVLSRLSIKDGILGQYEGYVHERGVNSYSKTETFAVLKVDINNERWSGVPFFVRAGKCLDKKETAIYIKFKRVDCLLTKSGSMESNYLKILVDPESAFTLSLNAKKPGVVDELIPVKMEFCHSCQFAALTPEAYEVILRQVVQGYETISVRFDEIEHAWQSIDQAYSRNFVLCKYECGSQGPDEMDEFEKKHGVRWLS